jgi:hypothetical protein
MYVIFCLLFVILRITVMYNSRCEASPISAGSLTVVVLKTKVIKNLQHFMMTSQKFTTLHDDEMSSCKIGPVKFWLGSSSGCILRARAFAGLTLWVWGLDCGLSPKTRPGRAWALGLCSISPSPTRP